LELAVTDEVTASTFEMYPKDVFPFFPVEDAIGVGFQMFGDLSEGDSKGFGVDAAA
jgi:hypothetical protein